MDGHIGDSLEIIVKLRLAHMEPGSQGIGGQSLGSNILELLDHLEDLVVDVAGADRLKTGCKGLGHLVENAGK